MRGIRYANITSDKFVADHHNFFFGASFLGISGQHGIFILIKIMLVKPSYF